MNSVIAALFKKVIAHQRPVPVVAASTKVAPLE
jgi:hypothetical protein